MHMKQFQDTGRVTTERRWSLRDALCSPLLSVMRWCASHSTGRGNPSRVQLIPGMEDIKWEWGETKLAGLCRAKYDRKTPQGKNSKDLERVILSLRRVKISSGTRVNNPQLRKEPLKNVRWSGIQPSPRARNGACSRETVTRPQQSAALLPWCENNRPYGRRRSGPAWQAFRAKDTKIQHPAVRFTVSATQSKFARQA